MLTLLGFVLIGVVTSIGLLLVADHYYPDTIRNIPVLNTISDSIFVAYKCTTSWLSDLYSNLFCGSEAKAGGGLLFPTPPNPPPASQRPCGREGGLELLRWGEVGIQGWLA